MCNKPIFLFCFLVQRDSGDLPNFLKIQKVSNLTPGRTFLKKINMLSEVSRCQGKIGQQPITKKIVLMAAKPNFLVLLPLVPFIDTILKKKC